MSQIPQKPGHEVFANEAGDGEQLQSQSSFQHRGRMTHTSGNIQFNLSQASGSSGSHSANRSMSLPCGLSPLLFAAIMALMTFLIGGALGGGLGVGLSKSSASGAECSSASTSSASASTGTPHTSSSSAGSSSTSSTATASNTASSTFLTTNLTVPTYTSVVSLAYSCPALNTELHTDDYGQSYSFTCAAVYGVHQPADPEYGGLIGNLASLVAYSIDDCTLMCSLWNTDKDPAHYHVCRGVSWSPLMSVAVKDYGANCVLKNATGPLRPLVNPYFVSAKLEI